MVSDEHIGRGHVQLQCTRFLSRPRRNLSLFDMNMMYIVHVWAGFSHFKLFLEPSSWFACLSGY